MNNRFIYLCLITIKESKLFEFQAKIGIFNRSNSQIDYTNGAKFLNAGSRLRHFRNISRWKTGIKNSNMTTIFLLSYKKIFYNILFDFKKYRRSQISAKSSVFQLHNNRISCFNLLNYLNHLGYSGGLIKFFGTEYSKMLLISLNKILLNYFLFNSKKNDVKTNYNFDYYPSTLQPSMLIYTSTYLFKKHRQFFKINRGLSAGLILNTMEIRTKSLDYAVLQLDKSNFNEYWFLTCASQFYFSGYNRLMLSKRKLIIEKFLFYILLKNCINTNYDLNNLT